MTDIRPFLKEKLHVIVKVRARCKKCGRVNVETIHDYGVLTYGELDKQMDQTMHAIRPITCPKCQYETMPETIIYRDELRKVIITEQTISYGHATDRVEWLDGQERRFDVFKEQEADFWEKYTAYALAHWRDMLNELVDFEFRDAYRALGIETNARTIAQYRKDALNRFRTTEEKQQFWRAANHYFVYDHLLDIGPIGWVLEKDVKHYGQKRMRYIVLHFPMHESLETFRTELIGRLVRKEKGDNKFLFRRIGMLTDELTRTKNKLSNAFEQVEKLKAEKSKLEEKLSAAYGQIEKEQERKTVIQRDPADIQKIHELKSFVGELLAELKQKNQLLSELRQEKVHSPVELSEQEDESTDALERLQGKTVAIIGGWRQEQAQQEYPCQVLVHPGDRLDVEFYRTLKQADVMIVLTQFISHMAMWEAKAYALQHDVPIYFVKGLNIPKLLLEVTRKL